MKHLFPLDSYLFLNISQVGSLPKVEERKDGFEVTLTYTGRVGAVAKFDTLEEAQEWSEDLTLWIKSFVY